MGGPLGTVTRLVNTVGPQVSMSYLTHLTSGQDTYISRIDYFPTICPEPHELLDEAVFEDYLEDSGDEEVKKGEVPEESDGEKITKAVTEGKPAKIKNKEGKSAAEKKDRPAEKVTKPVDDTMTKTTAAPKFVTDPKEKPCITDNSKLR